MASCVCAAVPSTLSVSGQERRLETNNRTPDGVQSSRSSLSTSGDQLAGFGWRTQSRVPGLTPSAGDWSDAVGNGPVRCKAPGASCSTLPPTTPQRRTLNRSATEDGGRRPGGTARCFRRVLRGCGSFRHVASLQRATSASSLAITRVIMLAGIFTAAVQRLYPSRSIQIACEPARTCGN